MQDEQGSRCVCKCILPVVSVPCTVSIHTRVGALQDGGRIQQGGVQAVRLLRRRLHLPQPFLQHRDLRATAPHEHAAQVRKAPLKLAKASKHLPTMRPTNANGLAVAHRDYAKLWHLEGERATAQYSRLHAAHQAWCWTVLGGDHVSEAAKETRTSRR